MAANPTIVVKGKDEGASAVVTNVATKLDGMRAPVNRLGTSLGGVSKQLDGMHGPVNRLAASFGGLAGALGVGLISQSIRRIIEDLDELDETAQGLGVSALALSEMRIAAQQAGVGTEQLSKAMAGLNTKIKEATTGNHDAAALFEELGISIRDAAGKIKPTEVLFGELADAIKGFANDGSKGALLAEILGQKLGPKFAAYLNEGSEGLRKFSGFTEQSFEQSRKLHAEIDILSARFSAYHNSVVGDLATQINSWIELTKRVKEYGATFSTRGIIDNLGALDVALGIAKSRTDALIESERTGAAIAGQNADAHKKSADAILVGAKARAEAAKAAEAAEKARIAAAQAAAKAAAAAAAAFLDSLDKQVLKLNQNEFAVLRLEAAQKGVAKAAEPYIRKLEEAKNLQEAITAFVKDQERIEKERAESFDFTRDLENRVRLLADEAEMIGRSEIEQRQLTAAREIDAQVLERIRRLDDPAEISRAFDAGEAAKRTAALAIETAATRKSQLALQGLLVELENETAEIGLSTAARQRSNLLRNLEASGIDTTSDAYRAQLEIIERIADATQKNEDRKQLQADIESLSAATADLIGEFSRTGDINAFFKNLSQRILDFTTELLVVRPLMLEFQKILTGQANSGQPGSGSLLGIIGQLIGGAFGGGAANSSAFSGAYYGGSGASFAAGTDYVPKTGWAKLHEGEAVIPKSENTGKMRGNVTNNLQIVMPQNVTPATMKQTGATIARQLAVTSRRLN